MTAGERPGPHVLREYALLADGERGALVGPRGEIAWMCFPRWDSEGVFSALIGGGGSYAVTPVGRFVWGGYYERPGLIWRSRWICDDGSIIECREALALPGEADRAVLLRRVIARERVARVRAVLALCTDFGRTGAEDLRRDEDGTWSARVGDIQARWTGAADAAPRTNDDGELTLELQLEIEGGEHHDLVLVLDREAGSPLPQAERTWLATEATWKEWVPDLGHTIAPRDARHAYAVLRGLTSSGGGMVAAATTSLPERAQEGRNYDYRYVWIRDQCYAGQAVALCGAHPLLDDAARFVTERLLEDGAELKPAYTTLGARVPDERELDLSGYPGGRDIVGNHANEQFQLDAFGEALLLLAVAAEHDRLDADGWQAVEVAVQAIERRWREPDAGIWELEADRWTHSRLTCAAGVRAICRRRQDGERTRDWLALADLITARTSSTALHRSGRWQRSREDERIDAALLMPALRGAIAPDDPRSLATLRAVEDELTEDGFCYRYRPDERPLGEAEGAFLLCGFMMALAYNLEGRHVEAARWFERNRTACGPPGLLSEEFDVAQRQLRGNLPQAFVHALLLECASRLVAEP